MECKKFEPNIFNKSKCSNCFKTKEDHSAKALESNRASHKICKCGYLFVAPDWDFTNPLNRTKRWQRRWFVLYEDGEFTYSLDEHPETVPQSSIEMIRVLEVTDAEPLTGNAYSLAITQQDRVTFVKATSKEEVRWWMESLSSFIRSRGRLRRHATFPGGRVSTRPKSANPEDLDPSPKLFQSAIGSQRPRSISSCSDAVVDTRMDSLEMQDLLLSEGHLADNDNSSVADSPLLHSSDGNEVRTVHFSTESPEIVNDTSLEKQNMSDPPSAIKIAGKSRLRRILRRGGTDYQDDSPDHLMNRSCNESMNDDDNVFSESGSSLLITPPPSPPRIFRKHCLYKRNNYENINYRRDDHENESFEFQDKSVRGDPDGCGLDTVQSSFVLRNSESPLKTFKTVVKDDYLIKKGWLMKLDYNKWQKYWFALEGGVISFFSDPNGEENHLTLGLIDLGAMKHIEPIDGAKNYGFKIHMWDGNVHVLSAMTMGIRTNWIEIIRHCAFGVPHKPKDVNVDDSDHSKDSDKSGIGQEKKLLNMIKPINHYNNWSVDDSIDNRFRSFSSRSLDVEKHDASETLGLHLTNDLLDNKSESLNYTKNKKVPNQCSNVVNILPASPPLNRTPISRVKERARMVSRQRVPKRSRILSPPNNQSTPKDDGKSDKLFKPLREELVSLKNQFVYRNRATDEDMHSSVWSLPASLEGGVTDQNISDNELLLPEPKFQSLSCATSPRTEDTVDTKPLVSPVVIQKGNEIEWLEKERNEAKMGCTQAQETLQLMQGKVSKIADVLEHKEQELREKIIELEQFHSRYVNERKEWDGHVDKLKRRLTEIGPLETEKERLEKEKEEIREKLVMNQKKMEETENEMNEIRSKEQGLILSLEKERSRIGDRDQTIGKLVSENKELEYHLQELEEDKNGLREAVRLLDGQLCSLEEQQETDSKEYESLKKKLEETMAELKTVSERLQTGIEENDHLRSRLRELEGNNLMVSAPCSPSSSVNASTKRKSNSLSSLVASKEMWNKKPFSASLLPQVESLSDLTNVDLDIDVTQLDKQRLEEEFSQLVLRFNKSISEIWALKKELRLCQRTSDDLELNHIQYQRGFEMRENEFKSQIDMMAHRIQDLTNKLTAAEKQVRQLKLRGVREKRSLSLKGRESFTISQEMEAKLVDLEKKLLSIEQSFQGPSSSELSTTLRDLSSIPLSLPQQTTQDGKQLSLLSQQDVAKGVGCRKDRVTRRKSLDSALCSEPLKLVVRLNELEKRANLAVEKGITVQQHDSLASEGIEQTPILNSELVWLNSVFDGVTMRLDSVVESLGHCCQNMELLSPEDRKFVLSKLKCEIQSISAKVASDVNSAQLVDKKIQTVLDMMSQMPIDANIGKSLLYKMVGSLVIFKLLNLSTFSLDSYKITECEQLCLSFIELGYSLEAKIGTCLVQAEDVFVDKTNVTLVSCILRWHESLSRAFQQFINGMVVKVTLKMSADTLHEHLALMNENFGHDKFSDNLNRALEFIRDPETMKLIEIEIYEIINGALKSEFQLLKRDSDFEKTEVKFNQFVGEEVNKLIQTILFRYETILENPSDHSDVFSLSNGSQESANDLLKRMTQLVVLMGLLNTKVGLLSSCNDLQQQQITMDDSPLDYRAAIRQGEASIRFRTSIRQVFDEIGTRVNYVPDSTAPAVPQACSLDHTIDECSERVEPLLEECSVQEEEEDQVDGVQQNDSDLDRTIWHSLEDLSVESGDHCGAKILSGVLKQHPPSSLNIDRCSAEESSAKMDRFNSDFSVIPHPVELDSPTMLSKTVSTPATPQHERCESPSSIIRYKRQLSLPSVVQVPPVVSMVGMVANRKMVFEKGNQCSK